MKFGYTIFYVKDVAATVAFYEGAFGLPRRFVHESGQYAEMETGSTALAFVDMGMADFNGVPVSTELPSETCPAVEIAFVTDDVPGAFAKAVAAGAEAIGAPKEKPWGQVVAYVRDCNGFLVELCTPMG